MYKQVIYYFQAEQKMSNLEHVTISYQPLEILLMNFRSLTNRLLVFGVTKKMLELIYCGKFNRLWPQMAKYENKMFQITKLVFCLQIIIQGIFQINMAQCEFKSAELMV